MTVIKSSFLEHQIFPIDKVACFIDLTHHFVTQCLSDRKFVGIDIAAIIRFGFSAHHDPFFPGIIIEIAMQALKAHIAVVVYLALTTRAAFGSYQDDTVAGTCTINGLRGRVFQYLNGFDVIGVYHGKLRIAGHTAIDDIQRRVTCRDGARATNFYGGYSSRPPGGTGNSHSRSTSAKHLCCVGCRKVFHITGIDGGNGRRDIAFAHRSISDNNYIIEQLALRFQFHVDCGLPFDSHMLALITQIAEYQGGIR